MPRTASGIVAVICIFVSLLGIAAFLFHRFDTQPPSALHTILASSPKEVVPDVIQKISVPEEVRGIYLNVETAGSAKRLAPLLKTATEHGINTVVVDTKNDNGSLAFVPKDAALKAPERASYDIGALVHEAHTHGLYLVARIPVFQDPAFARTHPSEALHSADGSFWSDRKGVLWLDPASRTVWENAVVLAREVSARGFDEVQFDYVRFPTDGDTHAINFPYYDRKKQSYREVITSFFAYLDSELRTTSGIRISVDLFGLTTWHQSDIGVGQWFEDALMHFDYLSPMVYPSHYGAGTLGFANPAVHPYEIVADSMRKANEAMAALKGKKPEAKIAQMRPWLQAFNIGATYTSALVEAQVKATRENKNSGFLLWNAVNRYDMLPDFTK